MRQRRGRTTDGGVAGVSLELGRCGPLGPAVEMRLSDLEAEVGARTGGRRLRLGLRTIEIMALKEGLGQTRNTRAPSD